MKKIKTGDQVIVISGKDRENKVPLQRFFLMADVMYLVFKW